MTQVFWFELEPAINPFLGIDMVCNKSDFTMCRNQLGYTYVHVVVQAGTCTRYVGMRDHILCSGYTYMYW